MDNETKQGFEAMAQAMEAMEARIMKRFDATDEKIFDVETKLLSAFRDWSRPIETRLRTLPLIDERLGFLEERISALERKNLERGL